MTKYDNVNNKIYTLRKKSNSYHSTYLHPHLGILIQTTCIFGKDINIIMRIRIKLDLCVKNNNTSKVHYF